jgi:hypothetical protein
MNAAPPLTAFHVFAVWQIRGRKQKSAYALFSDDSI